MKVFIVLLLVCCIVACSEPEQPRPMKAKEIKKLRTMDEKMRDRKRWA